LTTAKPRFDCPDREELERDNVWWKIYRESFPTNEQESPAVILESTARGAAIAFRARCEDRTVGIATTHLLLNPAAAFLVYLAVHKEERGTGIGGALFEFVWSISLSRLRERGSGGIGMVWEVDPPGVIDDPVEAAARDRRIEFFRRHGGVTLLPSYFQPPLADGPPVPMQLMFRAPANHPIPDSAVTKELVAAIYFEKYGAANGIPHGTLTALLSRNTIPGNVDQRG
jgi:GNAT superfamily N-acetyltransferase